VKVALALLASLVLAAGCADPAPGPAAGPPAPAAGPLQPYGAPETVSGTRDHLLERIHQVQDQLAGWIRELEAGRRDAVDPARLEDATGRLRAVQDDLERVRVRAHAPDAVRHELEDLERATIRLQADGDKAHRDGLAALGRPA
jgi:hypothetical protein